MRPQALLDLAVASPDGTKAVVQKEQNAVQAAQAKIEEAKARLRTAAHAVKMVEQKVQQSRALSVIKMGATGGRCKRTSWTYGNHCAS